MTLTYSNGASGPSCGNGVQHPYEACDDGNTHIGDGCSAQCEIEPGWVCTGYVGGQSICQYNPPCPLNCHNGGSCQMLANGQALCVCAGGWKGASCEVDMEMCPCGFCREECWEGEGAYWHCCTRDGTCSGHGECRAEPWSCDCEPLYSEWNCSVTATPTATPTVSTTSTATVTALPTRTLTPGLIPSGTPTGTVTATATETGTCTGTGSDTATTSPVASRTESSTGTDHVTVSCTASATLTSTSSGSDMATVSASASATGPRTGMDGLALVA